MHILVRPDWPILHQMLEKALLTLTPGDIAALEYKWLGEIRPGVDGALNLTQEEKAFLDTHPKIRVANELDWPPFDFIQNGEPAGFAIDYVRLLAEIIGLELEFINGHTWSQLLEKGRQKEIDLFPGLWKSPDREEFLAFTRPYIQLIKVLVTRKDVTSVKSLADMTHRKIALPAGYTLTEIIMDHYPGLDYVMVKIRLKVSNWFPGTGRRVLSGPWALSTMSSNSSSSTMSRWQKKSNWTRTCHCTWPSEKTGNSLPPSLTRP